MIVIGRIKKGAYFDSVTLMGVAKEINETEGVIDAAVVMGTRENIAILAASGLLIDEFEKANDTDLLIGLKSEDKTIAASALKIVDVHLENVRNKGESETEFQPMSIESALKIIPEANLALISVAGRFAGREAMKALEKGLHVMLFSDNVPLEIEIELKKLARKKGLLVMGPDCGTAIINGVPLAFANSVRRGNIGIVAASGTGLQEVITIISNEGCGISQAIGSGSRDITRAVGGLMFIEALKALAEDDQTEIILLVSKPPHSEVLERITEIIESIDKPVVSIFLGPVTKHLGLASTLEEAALMTVSLAKCENPIKISRHLEARNNQIEPFARQEARRRKTGQKFVRGLFSGGTFCTEAQVILATMISGLYSNVPIGNTIELEDSMQSVMNTVIDLGADEFTVGRPHPMIDYSLRVRRIQDAANDPQTAVILLDVVLGYGANPDPVSELGDVILAACEHVSVVCSITGTDQDPQNKKVVENALTEAGAVVMPTNAAACWLAAKIVQSLSKWARKVYRIPVSNRTN